MPVEPFWKSLLQEAAWLGWRITAAVEGQLDSAGAAEKDFVRSESYLLGMAWHGAATSQILRRGGGRRQSDRRRAKASAYGAAVIEPADSRSRTGAWRSAIDPRPARNRTDRIGASVSRSRTGGTAAGRGGRRSSATSGATCKNIIRHRLPDRLRDGLASGCHGHAARRT